MPSRIEDYALIGDCETAALVSKDGSIDWLCWPRFDSGACFSALLGDPSHGRWSIAPAAVGSDIKVSRCYAHNTLILETEFASADGKNAVVLIDFMPLREGRNASHLVRLVVGKRGSMAMRTEWIVRFGYGGWEPWVSRTDAGDLVAIADAVARLVGIEGGVVSGVFHLESSGVRASDWRPRHDKRYHEA